MLSIRETEHFIRQQEQTDRKVMRNFAIIITLALILFSFLIWNSVSAKDYVSKLLNLSKTITVDIVYDYDIELLRLDELLIELDQLNVRISDQRDLLRDLEKLL